MITATVEVTAVADPEMRFTPAGKGICTVRVVSNKRVKDSNGQWKDGDPSYFNVIAWDRLAERIVENVSKGQRLLVTGRMENRPWEDREGNKRTSMELTANAVGLDIKFTDYTRSEAKGGAQTEPTPVSPSGQPVSEAPF